MARVSSRCEGNYFSIVSDTVHFTTSFSTLNSDVQNQTNRASKDTVAHIEAHISTKLVLKITDLFIKKEYHHTNHLTGRIDTVLKDHILTEDTNTHVSKINAYPAGDLCTPTRTTLCFNVKKANRFVWYIAGDTIASRDSCITVDIPARLIGTLGIIRVDALKDDTLIFSSSLQYYKINFGYAQGTYTIPSNVTNMTQLWDTLNLAPGTPITPSVLPGGAGTLVIGLGGRFSIDQNSSFVGLNIGITNEANTSINIHPATTFKVTNCYFHDMNDALWLGITLNQAGTSTQTQVARLIMTGSTLEHAFNGITGSGADMRKRNFATAIIDSCCLNENRTHIRMWHNSARLVTPAGASPLSLTRSILTCLEPLPGTDNYTDTAITIRDVNSAIVGNQNEGGWQKPNSIDSCNIGILCEESRVGINNNNLSNLWMGRQNGILATAIRIKPSNRNIVYPVNSINIGDLQPNNFFENRRNSVQRAVYITGNGVQTTIQNNNFKDIWNNSGSQSSCVRLDDLQNATITVTQNTLNSIETGVHIVNSDTVNSNNRVTVTENRFKNYKNGVYALQTGICRYGLDVIDNYFNNYVDLRPNFSPPINNSEYDAGILLSSVSSQNFSNQTRINANTFAGIIQTGIYTIGDHSHSMDGGLTRSYAEINDNLIGPQNPGGNVRFAGIYVTSAPYTEIKGNSISCQPTGFTPGDSVVGIELVHTNENNVSCNKIRYANHGIRVWGNCMPNLNLMYSFFNYCENGITVSNGVMGDQGFGNAVLRNPGDPNLVRCNYNAWGSPLSMRSLTLTDGATITNNRVVGEPLMMGYDPGVYPHSGNALVNPPPVVRPVRFCHSDSNFFVFTRNATNEILLKNNNYLSMVHEKISSDASIDEINRNAITQFNLLKFLSEPGNPVLAENAVLDSFYTAKQGTTLSGLVAIDRLILNNRKQARNFNSLLVATNQVEANQIGFNKIYFDYLDGKTIHAGQYQELVRIAEQCPGTGGKSVIQARVLRGALEMGLRKYDDDCVKPSAYKTSPTAAQIAGKSSVKIYPNPARSEVQIEYYLEVDARTLSLISINGEVIRNIALQNKKGLITMDISNLAAGVYACKIEDLYGNTVSVQKLIITE